MTHFTFLTRFSHCSCKTMLTALIHTLLIACHNCIGYTELKRKGTCKWWIWRDGKGSRLVSFWSNIIYFLWKDSAKPRKTFQLPGYCIKNKPVISQVGGRTATTQTQDSDCLCCKQWLKDSPYERLRVVLVPPILWLTKLQDECLFNYCNATYKVHMYMHLCSCSCHVKHWQQSFKKRTHAACII